MKSKIKGCTHHETKVLKMATGGIVPGPNIAKRMSSPVGPKRSTADESGIPAVGTTPTDTTQTNTTTSTKPTMARLDVGKEFERFNRKIDNGTLDQKYGFFKKGSGRPETSMGFLVYLGDRLGKKTQPKKDQT